VDNRAPLIAIQPVGIIGRLFQLRKLTLGSSATTSVGAQSSGRAAVLLPRMGSATTESNQALD
jgi:hypothetical protein